MQMLKDKKVVIAVVVVLLLILGGGGYYFLGMKSAKSVQSMPSEDDTMNVQTLVPESIGLDFKFRADGKAGKIVVGNVKDIKTIEYQLSYQKNQEGEDVPEGLIGDIDMTKAAGGKVETDYREFGTCSSGHCRYDNVTSPIKVTLKITKDDGKVYQSEKSFDLPR
jgi:hypothetical protein